MKHIKISGKCMGLVLVAFVLISNHALAQHVLHGTVLDDQNNPLPGATVLIKNSNDGTVADVDGKFLIEVANPNVILQISFIGYTTLEVPAGAEREKSFTLQTNIDQLKEIVVVGYGTQEKVTVTGAVSNVSVESIQKASTPSIANSIGGKLPGIITRQTSGEPGYDAAQVFIRGLGTWGNREPLILVDGVERNMNQLNAQVIESFSVLKDASATAVFGVRGANGVILINTKRGKQGRPQVTFRTEHAVLKSLRLPDYINGYEYASLINEGLGNVGLSARYTDEELEKFRDGSDPYFYPNVNWIDEMFRETTSQSISNLSISGGSESTRYFVNAGYTNQSGIYKEDNLNDYKSNPTIKRYNFRSNVDVDLSKSFTISLGLAAIIQNGHYAGFGASTIWD
ncbi:MAG: SusC/RagA family TonB-linked outer membrane protein, partial [Fulvivirga sp.]